MFTCGRSTGARVDNRIWVFDIATDPAKPKLARTIADLGDKSGYLGAHTYYAPPGRMLVQALSNTKDKGGQTGMGLYNNKGQLIASYAMPTESGGDGYGYDLAVFPHHPLGARADAPRRRLRPRCPRDFRPLKRTRAARAVARAQGIPDRPGGRCPRDLQLEFPSPANRAQRHRDPAHGGRFSAVAGPEIFFCRGNVNMSG